MAENAGKREQKMSTKGINEAGKEKWAKHYSSNHQILLVGEGDFSFSMSLATSFGSASNIVATSFDLYDDLIKKYKKAKTNLEILRYFGAQLLHGVNAIKMNNHTGLRMRKFDRIVFNFPHCGVLWKESDEETIMEHKNLVQSFLWNARGMLRPNGEIHVTHKMTHPYSCWNIEELAIECGLIMVECAVFRIEDYPGYNNKRGNNRNPDLPFPLGKCGTFKFMVSSKVMKSPPEFPAQRQLKIILANLNPVIADWADGLTYLFELFIPDLSPLPEDLEPSSSSVGTGRN
ncbi:hypothetical protein L1887_25711 [Cichorium endivia]|nr:hypothetical protein L1887_25711 [Cichorium endivia]